MVNGMTIKLFPYTDQIVEPREIQVDCLDWIKSKWKNNKKFAICAPVGSGKSAIGLTLLRSSNHGLYTSPQNALVDQVSEGFADYVTTLKGRRHYPCLAGKMDCSVGYCKLSGACQEDGGQRVCTNSDQPNKCKDCGCKRCVYRMAFYAFQKSELGNTNFSLFLLGVNNSPDTIVIDEADQIESFVRLQYTYKINKKIRSDWTHALEDLALHEIELSSLLLKLGDKVRESQNQDVIASTNTQIQHIERELNHVVEILSDYETHGEEWVVSPESANRSVLQPVTTGRFIDPLLEGKKVVLMSATLSPTLRDQGYEYLEVGSPFDPSLRPWWYKPLGRMSLKHREKTLPLIATHLLGLPNGKTIVHCNSYKVAKDLGELLETHGIYPMVQTNGGTQNQYRGSVKRTDAITQFKESKNQREILLSVNLTRGVDLPEPDIINNIIVVLPFPNPTDPLVQKKNKILGKGWQGLAMAQEIQQAYGRVNRNDQKTTNTEILDSNWQWWFKANKKHFNKWFLDAQVNR